MSSTGLGKGLGALIRESAPVADSGDVHKLPLKDISPNPNQPRRRFTDQALGELALSIKSQGLLQPILVRPLGNPSEGKYQIVAGERRWRASKLAGLLEVPVVVKSFSDQETLAAALIENLQREDLNPVEEALGIQALKEEFALSQEELSSQLGKSRSAIANCLRLLSLPKSALSDLAEGRLSSGHARALLSITDEHAQEYLRNLILEEKLSVREAEGLAANWKQTGSFQGIEHVLTVAENLVEERTVESEAHETDNMQYMQDTHGNSLQTTQDIDAEKANEVQLSDAPQKKIRPQAALIMDIQQMLAQLLSVPVKVTGKEDKGKISIAYNSKEELAELLARFQIAGNSTSFLQLESDNSAEAEKGIKRNG